MRRIQLLLAVTTMVSPTVPAVSAQEPLLDQGSRPDSQQIREVVESAQARFERVRYQHLEVSFGHGSGTCDEQVGRYCYWHDGDDSWIPDPEDPEVAEERTRLLERLDSAAILLPGDAWIAGQRVRYSVESKNTPAAISIALSCRTERWWCLALEGYALHAHADFLASERAFESALAAMSVERRCEWTDMSLLLQGGLGGEYEDLECADRKPLESRLWWLADPLYLVPGNERRTEHFTRLVLNEILSKSRTVRRSRWGDDNRELLVRYGPIAGWERARSRATTLSSGDRVIGHHNPGGLSLIPRSEVVANLSALEPLTWDLEPDRPRSEYAPAYTKKLEWLKHNVVLFRRADSVVVVASFRLPEPDSSTHQPSVVETALAAAEGESTLQSIERGTGTHPIGLTIPFSGTMVSVEALSRTDSIAARARYWLDIPSRLENGTGGFAMSEILLVTADNGLPTTLDAAIPAALPPGDRHSGASIGLFWEMYGIGWATQTATMSITVEKEGEGFFRRVGKFLGLAGERRDRIQMRWEETVMPTAQLPRAVAVRLTDDMEGEYVIAVRILLDTGEAAEVQRMVVVREREAGHGTTME